MINTELNDIVLTTGCFNIVHPGHIELLEFASKFGRLVVGINTDEYLKEKYGKETIPLNDRAYVLSSIKYVSEVVSFAERDPSQLIRKLRPRVFIKGPDYKVNTNSLPELVAIQDMGIRLILQPGMKRYSSSKLLLANKA